MENEEKLRLEKEHSQKMNDEAVDRIKKAEEPITKAEAERIEAVWFEDDAEVRLRDGKRYKVPPVTLRDARRLMQLIKTVNVDAIILNFLPTGDDEEDNKRAVELFEIMRMAFQAYPEIDDAFIDKNVDVVIAKDIIDTMIGLNGLKK